MTRPLRIFADLLMYAGMALMLPGPLVYALGDLVQDRAGR